MFSFYGGKCLSCKAVHNWVEKFSQGRSKVANGARPGAKWLRQQSKDFSDSGFDALVKWWDKCMDVGGGFVEKWTFLSQVRISHVLRFISNCNLFTDSPSYLPLRKHRLVDQTRLPVLLMSITYRHGNVCGFRICFRNRSLQNVNSSSQNRRTGHDTDRIRMCSRIHMESISILHQVPGCLSLHND
jgi:hypothetical protein